MTKSILRLTVVLSLLAFPGCSSRATGDAPTPSVPDAATSFSPPLGFVDAAGVPSGFVAMPRADASADAGLPPCDHVPVQEDCSNGWCRIPPGCFIMGSPRDEWGRGKYSETQVHVTLTRAFEIQQLETTQAEWTSVGLANPSGESIHCNDCPDPNCPVGDVNWYETLVFLNRYSEARGLAPCYILEGCTGEVGHGQMVCTNVRVNAPSLYACEGYRLPTEAEWEYAVRAGTTTPLYSGAMVSNDEGENCFPDPNIEAIGWLCASNPEPYWTHPGGKKMPNAWGLYDMAGNAAEWVNDRFNGLGYGEGKLVDPFGQLEVGSDWEIHGVLRGGFASTFNVFARSAKRFEAPRDGHSPCIGLRMVRTLP